MTIVDVPRSSNPTTNATALQTVIDNGNSIRLEHRQSYDIGTHVLTKTSTSTELDLDLNGSTIKYGGVHALRCPATGTTHARKLRVINGTFRGVNGYQTAVMLDNHSGTYFADITFEESFAGLQYRNVDTPSGPGWSEYNDTERIRTDQILYPLVLSAAGGNPSFARHRHLAWHLFKPYVGMWAGVDASPYECVFTGWKHLIAGRHDAVTFKIEGGCRGTDLQAKVENVNHAGLRPIGLLLTSTAHHVQALDVDLATTHYGWEARPAQDGQPAKDETWIVNQSGDGDPRYMLRSKRFTNLAKSNHAAWAAAHAA